MDEYKVTATIVEIRGDGVCSYGHRVGDSFDFSDVTPAGLCQFAYDALHAAAAVLLYGGRFPWVEDGEPSTWSCPDPDRPVIFQLARVPVDKV
jgi:uncharacterized repeat protein (TIGR04076 family)